MNADQMTDFDAFLLTVFGVPVSLIAGHLCDDSLDEQFNRLARMAEPLYNALVLFDSPEEAAWYAAINAHGNQDGRERADWRADDLRAWQREFEAATHWGGR